ncbi:MAG: phage portal protein [Pseudomonadota bacterium]
MGVVKSMRDGLVSMAGRIGTDESKVHTAQYGFSQLSDEQLEAAFRTSWAIDKAVRIPSMDATRKWRVWSGDGSAEVSEAEELARLSVRLKVQEAHWKSRLWGGAAILIGAPGQPDTPLEVGTIGQGDLRYLTVLTRQELHCGEEERDAREPNFGDPKYYRIMTGSTAAESMEVHPSRLVIFKGRPLPRRHSSYATDYGWGDSILYQIHDACRNLDATMENIASLVFDAKTDVVKIPDLMRKISDQNYENDLVKRFSAMRRVASNHSVKILDKEEEYESKSYGFGGLDAVADRFMQVAAAAADIPMTRFLAQSPGGLNSTGDGDLANYYDRVKAIQELEMVPAMQILDEVLVRSTIGDWPEDLKADWAPLKEMSEKEISDLRNKDADTVGKLSNAQIFDDEAVAEAGAQMFKESGIDSLEGAGVALDNELAPNIADAAPRTLYVHRKVMNGEAIIAWAKGQGFPTTLPADDLHVTIAFSRHAVDWMKTGADWEPEIKVPEGGPRLMERFGDARVLLFASAALSWRHESIKRMANATWDHPEYQPHITISYDEGSPDLSNVEPYKGPIVLGPEVFQEVKEDWVEGIKEE